MEDDPRVAPTPLTAGVALLAEDFPVASVRENSDERLRGVAHHVLPDREELERGRVPAPSPAAEEAAHLLLEGHNRVDSEVATLAGIRDANGAGEEEPRGQDLQAAPTGQDFELETREF